MSYEGYVQHICAKGHRYDCDVYAELDTCPVCQSESVFSNQVDETNYESYGIIPEVLWEILLVTPQTVAVCNLGHEHVLSPAIYRPPTKEEYPLLRAYWDGYKYVSFEPDSPLDKKILP